MPETQARVSLVISVNDLEAHAIRRLCGDVGADIDIVDLEGDWGEGIALGRPELQPDALADTVILVETPSPELEDRLRRAGKQVHIVDHHLYVTNDHGILDRRSIRSSIEQVAGLLGREDWLASNERERLIAANDRGFWPGMKAEVLAMAPPPASAPQDGDGKEAGWAKAFADMRTVRCREIAFRQSRDLGGEAVDAATRALSDAADALGALFERKKAVFLGTGRLPTKDGQDRGLYLVRAPERLRGTLLDALYLRDWDPQGKGKGSPPAHDAIDVLAVYVRDAEEEDEAAAPVLVEFSGHADVAPLIQELIEASAEPGGPHTALKLWASSGENAAYLGAQAFGGVPSADLSALADRLLDNLLVGNRPLRRWRTHFLQVLSYAEETEPCIVKGFEGVLIPGLPEWETHEDPPFEQKADKKPKPNAGAKRDGKKKSNNGPRRQDQDRAYILRHLRPLLTPGASSESIESLATNLTAPEGNPADVPKSVAAGTRLNGSDLAVQTYSLKVPKRRAGQDARKDGAGRQGPGNLTLTVTDPNRQNQTVRAEITQVNLHFCFNRLVVLDWTCEGAWEGYTDGGADWRRYLGMADGPDARGADTVRTVAQLLDFNNAARNCYSSFANRFEAKTIRLNGTDWGDRPVAAELQFGEDVTADVHRPQGWFGALADAALAPFGLKRKHVELVHDERARVVSTCIMAGGRRLLPSGRRAEDALLARLRTVEPYGQGHFYQEAFSLAELAPAVYDRFEHMDSRYAASSHSFVLLGTGWFPADVLVGHMGRMYRRLFLLALLYSAVFHSFSEEMSRISRERLDLDHRKDDADSKTLDALTARVAELRRRFVGFANGLWFEDVSGQMQGEELFRLMTRQVPIKAHYAELTAEIERTDQLERQDAADRADRARTLFGALGGFVAGTVLGLEIVSVTGLKGWWAALLVLVLALAAPFLLYAGWQQVDARQAARDLARELARFVRRLLGRDEPRG